MADILLPCGKEVQQKGDMKQFSADSPASFNWPVGESFPGKVGDRVWFLLKNRGNVAIVAFGFIIEAPMQIPDSESHQLVVSVDIKAFENLHQGGLIKKEIVNNVLTRKYQRVKVPRCIPDAIGESFNQLILTSNEDGDFRKWTPKQLEVLISHYFQLLREQESPGSAEKDTSKHKIEKHFIVNRSWGSIKRKFSQISTMLKVRGFPFLREFKPNDGIEDFLSAPIEQTFKRELAKIAQLMPEKYGPKLAYEKIFVDPPPAPPGTRGRRSNAELKRDFEAIYKEKLLLGEEGELYVVEGERGRLIGLGRADLAKMVQRVSLTNDAAGFDILSFDVEPTGEVRTIFIEVKTTNGPIDEPFFMNRNERAVVEEKGTAYQIFRIFNFNTKPKIYTIQGPLEDKLEFRCEVFSVTPK